MKRDQASSRQDQFGPGSCCNWGPIPIVHFDQPRHCLSFCAGCRQVFTDGQGRALRRNRFSAIWRQAVAAADAPDGTRFHDLRHFYASLLIHAGESVKTVQNRLGHSSAMETLDVYSHLFPDSEDSTRKVVEEAFAMGAVVDREDDLRTSSSA